MNTKKDRYKDCCSLCARYKGKQMHGIEYPFLCANSTCKCHSKKDCCECKCGCCGSGTGWPHEENICPNRHTDSTKKDTSQTLSTHPKDESVLTLQGKESSDDWKLSKIPRFHQGGSSVEILHTGTCDTSHPSLEETDRRARQSERARIIKLIEGKKREIGEGTWCITCKQHIAAGECDCHGWNQALDSLLEELK